MTRTIWLASYPKSGNTWFRLLVANLSAESGKPVDINDPAAHDAIASARVPFDHLLLIDSGLLSHEEADNLRPRVYEEMKRSDGEPAQAVRFVKVHDAYSMTTRGEALLAGSRAADGAIVIVRDPRDIAPSLANHRNTDIDEAIAFLNDRNADFSGTRDRQHRQLRQKLRGWSGHVASWLDQTDIPVCLVRYEDIKADAARTVIRALHFAGHPATEEEVARAISATDFERLRAQEREAGFREAPSQGTGPFFRRGKVGGWRDELTAAQAKRIEEANAAMMSRLGYSPSYATGAVGGGAR